MNTYSKGQAANCPNRNLFTLCWFCYIARTNPPTNNETEFSGILCKIHLPPNHVCFSLKKFKKKALVSHLIKLCREIDPIVGKLY